MAEQSIANGQSIKRRDRSREGAGKSDASWIKHDLIRKAAGGQLGAFRAKHRGRLLLIDGNAGDGIGAPVQQLDWLREDLSKTTAELVIGLANDVGGADVVLCEANPQRRNLLQDSFPDAVVLADHAEAPSYICRDHVYALWLSDPCGPRDHGVEHMATVAQQIKSDFVVVFNEGWIRTRCVNTRSEHWAKHREKYPPMLEPDWWLSRLHRRHMSRTSIINASSNFKYRVMVISNFLTDAAKRRPFEVVR